MRRHHGDVGQNDLQGYHARPRFHVHRSSSSSEMICSIIVVNKALQSIVVCLHNTRKLAKDVFAWMALRDRGISRAVRGNGSFPRI